MILRKKILLKFSGDAVGQICKEDPIIHLIGTRLWDKQKRKGEKSAEVRKSVMADMRRLGTLYSKVVDLDPTYDNG